MYKAIDTATAPLAANITHTPLSARRANKANKSTSTPSVAAIWR
jgi:hypothetical protein